METKLSSKEFEHKVSNWNFNSHLAIDSVGRKGWLALCWTRDVNLHVMSYSNNYISVSIESMSMDLRGFLWRTNYGEKVAFLETARPYFIKFW